ncbi:MAG TPA: sugar-transfer associated ATP-grasp domain-containing protein [Mucilaginibacter sp.]|nr:sugar-transfer associated ATP-grasp domain-containing protein [Mucilaginibacter sp.]
MESKKEWLVRKLIKHRINKNSKDLVKQIALHSARVDVSLNPQIVAAYKEKWGRIFKGDINTDWLKWYTAISGIQSADYIPENVFYGIVEPIINNSRFTVAYSDKNFYDLVYPKDLFPKTLVRNMDGLYYDGDYQPLHLGDNEKLFNVLSAYDRVFVKPATEAGGGREVELFAQKERKFVNKEGRELTLELLEKIYKISFIIQTPLTQHPWLASFNPSSVNTVRVLTYRSPVTQQVNILQTVFRVGAKDQFLDNSKAGGYSIGMNNTGKLNKFATRKDGSKYDKVNDVSLAGNEFTIPYFDKIVAASKMIAGKNIHHLMLAMDMSIDEQGNIRCIEINNRSNEINFHQLNNGPLFGEFTDEVIAYCEKHTENLYKEFIITTIPFVP